MPIRFPTAQSLFDAFPEAASGMAPGPRDIASAAFLRNLAAADRFEDALTFCAYLLPRREAVWWACRSVRALLGDIAPASKPCLAAAEAWAQKPDDGRRDAALAAGDAADGDDPATWLARAAGWAGGLFVAHPERPVPVPQYMTPRASRIAVLLCARLVAKPERPARLGPCVADALKLAETGL